MGGQVSFFDGAKPLKIDKPMRLIELFAGIGAQAKALEKLGVPFEHYRICEFDKYAVASYIRGRNPNNPSDRTAGSTTQQRLEIGGDCSNTLTTVQKDNVLIEPNIRVRKLTPKECWRLMGFDDEDYERAAGVVSKSQLYRQAGNSIVVNVLMAIFKEMLP